MYFANRNDGLGERLCAIANAAWLAHASKSNFVFSWPELVDEKGFHSIDAVESVFNSEFIESRLIKNEITDSYKYITDFEPSLETLQHLGSSSELFVVPQGYISKFMLASGLLAKEAAASVRESIGFNDNIRLLQDKINSLPDSFFDIILHVRSGDICYGKYRNWVIMARKIIPVPYYDFYLSNNADPRREYRIIGQDKLAGAALTKKFDLLPVPRSISLFKGNNLECTFLDLFQFCAAKAIFSGGSGFTRFANRYSAVTVASPRVPNSLFLNYLFNNELELVSTYGAVQVAQSYLHVYYNSGGSIDQDEAIEAMSRAYRLDKRPLFYLIYALLDLSKTGLINKNAFQREIRLSVARECRRYSQSREDVLAALDRSLQSFSKSNLFFKEIPSSWLA